MKSRSMLKYRVSKALLDRAREAKQAEEVNAPAAPEAPAARRPGGRAATPLNFKTGGMLHTREGFGFMVYKTEQVGDEFKKKELVYMSRCYKCGLEIPGPAVASGRCCWCGFDANKDENLKAEIKKREGYR